MSFAISVVASSPNLKCTTMKCFYIVNKDANISNIIKFSEQDFQNLNSNRTKMRQLLFSLLQSREKSKHTKKTFCFIIVFRFFKQSSFRRELRNKFFVETVNEQATTFDQSNALKWVKINCNNQYDLNFEKNQIIDFFTDKQQVTLILIQIINLMV